MKYKLTPIGKLVIISFCLALVFLIFIVVNNQINKNNSSEGIKDTPNIHQPQEDNSKSPNDNNTAVEGTSDVSTTENVEPPIIEVTNSKDLMNNIKLSIYFGANVSILEEHYYQALDLFSQTALTLEGSAIQIEGNCSTTAANSNDAANNDLNYELSLSRAKVVSDYLQEKGIDPNRILIIGNGSSSPVKDNSTADNRKYNRRVDIFFRRTED